VISLFGGGAIASMVVACGRGDSTTSATSAAPATPSATAARVLAGVTFDVHRDPG
jgi:hypothetical protein